MNAAAIMTTRGALNRFWRDNAIAMGDPFSPHIPQTAMGIVMDCDCMFAELGMESDMKRLEEDGLFAQQCIKAYNDKAQQIVGRRLLDEFAFDPTRRLPRVKEVGELFECSRKWQSESWWLLEAAGSQEELEALLDRMDQLDLESMMFPDDWARSCRQVYERHGIKPVLTKHLRGPVTLATSIYGAENLIYLILDAPDLAGRFRDTLLRIILDYFHLCDRHSDPDQVHSEFRFFDDNCALLTPDMYAFFGQPILQAVYDTFAPQPGDLRYQHSDSDMAHLITLLAKTGMNRVNFGPNVRFQQIRRVMPHVIIEGTLEPFTFARNHEADIIAEVRRDLDEARLTRGLVVATAGSVNNGTRLTSLRTVMNTIRRYGRYAERKPKR